MTDDQILELASEYFVILNPFGGFDFKEYVAREDGILMFARHLLDYGFSEGHEVGYIDGAKDEQKYPELK